MTVLKEITYLSVEVIKKKEERPSDSLLNKDITTTEDTKNSIFIKGIFITGENIAVCPKNSKISPLNKYPHSLPNCKN